MMMGRQVLGLGESLYEQFKENEKSVGRKEERIMSHDVHKSMGVLIRLDFGEGL